MTVSGGPTYNNLSSQEAIGAIFNDKHQDTRSCSLRVANDAQTNYEEIPAGTIISKTWSGEWAPCAYDKASGAVAAANVITVAESENAPVSQFKAGDWLFYGGNTFPEKIQSVSKDNKQITTVGNITLADGDALEVDPSISVSSVQEEAATVNTATFETADHYKRFRVGDVVNIQTVTGARTITAIDTGTNTITFDGAATTITAGSLIVSQARGKYRVQTKTVYTNYGHNVQPDNVVAHYRTHGEAFAKKLRGMSPSIKAAMSPMLELLYIRV